jgi:hypothetical protein
MSEQQQSKQIVVNVSGDNQPPELATRQNIASGSVALPANFSNINVDPGAILQSKAVSALNSRIATLERERAGLERDKALCQRVQNDILKAWTTEKFTADKALATVVASIEANFPTRCEFEKDRANFHEAEEEFSSSVEVTTTDKSTSITRRYRERAPTPYLAEIPKIQDLDTRINDLGNTINKCRAALTQQGQLRMKADAVIATQALQSAGSGGQAILDNLNDAFNIDEFVDSIAGAPSPIPVRNTARVTEARSSSYRSYETDRD